MSRCRSCGARIIWYPTTSGARIPIDYLPVPGGNIVIEVGLLGEPVAHVIAPGSGDRVSHFATCPQAAEHRSAS